MNNWRKSMEAAQEALAKRVARMARAVLAAQEAQVKQAARAVLAAQEAQVKQVARAVLAAAREKRENKGSELILLPGAGLRDVLHVIYSPKIAERVFDQTILDMQLEWQEAIGHDRKWLARWVVVRGVLTVVITAAVHAVATLHSIFKLVK